MKRFNFVSVILLSLITCGLYYLHFLSVISINNNHIAHNMQRKTIMHVVAMVLLSVAAAVGLFFIDFMLAVGAIIIIPLIWHFLYFKQQCDILEVQKKNGFPSNNAVVMMLLFLVPIVNIYMVCENYNLGVNAYEGIV